MQWPDRLLDFLDQRAKRRDQRRSPYPTAAEILSVTDSMLAGTGDLMTIGIVRHLAAELLRYIDEDDLAAEQDRRATAANEQAAVNDATRAAWEGGQADPGTPPAGEGDL